jgi:D-alanyl-lipoteichoic acid acyltransferase DltB (MBOAT superfamily)
MLFTSWDFARFLLVVFPIYWALNGSLRVQNVWLLAASLVFYGWVAPWWLIPMAFTTLLDWSCSLGIDRVPKHRNKFLAASMIGNLGMLATFKYFNFFAENAAAALSALGFHVSPPVLRVVLPAGISFYTLQEMSYTIDVWRGEIRARRSLLDFSLFVTFFPHLVAGPIQRASKLLTQVERPRSWVTERFLSAFPLLVTGFFKKLVVADTVAGVVDRIFMLEAPSTPVLLAGSLAFSAQIFCDFSGYSDIARGAARLFGFELIENFRAPYLAKTLDDFWRRWHISLSTWIRDYLYIPLGGNQRKTALGRYAVLIATMAISGLWHGAAWTFVVWGLWHGIGLAMVRATGCGREWAERARAGALVSWAMTFAWVVLGFGLFRAHSLAWFVRGLARGGVANRGELLVAASVVANTAVLAIPAMVLYAALDALPRLRWLHSALRWSLVAAVVLLAKEGGREFIYFQF